MKNLLLLFTFSFSLNIFALEDYKQFFSKYCISCHGAEKKKGGVRLHQLKWDPNDTKSLELWRDVIDQIEQGEMPPEKKPQPKAEMLQKLSIDIKERFKSLSSTAKVVLRRLNKRQYTNTVRDLMHINAEQIDPAEAFPADDEIDGFNNVADAQMMSDFLLSKALHAGNKIINEAIFPEQKPEVETHSMGEEIRKGVREKYFWSGVPNLENGELNLYGNDEIEPGDTRGVSLISSYNGAPINAYYEFDLELESLGRGNYPSKTERIGLSQMRPSVQVYQHNDLHRLEIYFVKPTKKNTRDIRGLSRILVESIDLKDNERVTLKRRYWLNKGWRIQLAFGNGPVTGGAHRYYEAVLGKKIPKFEDKKEQKNWERNEAKKLVAELVDKENRPRIKFYSASRKGPIFESWPPKSHTQIHGENIEETLISFAQKAFRRPVKKDEVKHFVDLAKKSKGGIKTAIQAILCSPNFLYIVEDSDAELNDYEIANRLSYMFWNTMPDEELLDLAAKDKLKNQDMIRKQTLRMLADKKAEEFIHNFNWAWLKLKSTVNMAPDSVKFPEYKRDRINEAMLKETKLFFRDVLENNRPLSTFISADFAYLNSDLARRYGIDGVNTSAKFQKVAVNKESLRSGIFGQTAVLTASANGVDTSPVVRGIWILENLLGIHPPPPPSDVDIPEIDLRGEHTLKELYAKHRQLESCNSCHVKIDPLGFALENFNAVGMWRDKYKDGSEVDATGKMPDGTPFNGVSGLKQNILKDMTHFNRNFISKLMTYASGRTMKATDRTVIDAIVEKSISQKFGLRDLILEVVSSQIFIHK